MAKSTKNYIIAGTSSNPFTLDHSTIKSIGYHQSTGNTCKKYHQCRSYLKNRRMRKWYGPENHEQTNRKTCMVKVIYQWKRMDGIWAYGNKRTDKMITIGFPHRFCVQNIITFVKTLVTTCIHINNKPCDFPLMRLGDKTCPVFKLFRKLNIITCTNTNTLDTDQIPNFPQIKLNTIPRKRRRNP